MPRVQNAPEHLKGRGARPVAALVVLGVAALLAAGARAAAADTAHGAQVFRTCAACHSERSDALGPSLKGVVGRKAASLEGYRYSGPMRRANLVWDEANLRQYLADPQARIPGNRMPFGGLHDTKDVEDVIAYLKTLN
jgi:cytochrome c